MIRQAARAAAVIAVAVDCVGAWLDWMQGAYHLSLRWAAVATASALVPCALGFAVAVSKRLRQVVRRPRTIRTVDTMRLPLVVPRGYVGAAVLGGIATLAAMGEGFGFYIFLAGIALIALALSQAKARSALGGLHQF